MTESVLLALDGTPLPTQPAPDATPLVQEIESLRADLDALALTTVPADQPRRVASGSPRPELQTGQCGTHTPRRGISCSRSATSDSG